MEVQASQNGLKQLQKTIVAVQFRLETPTTKYVLHEWLSRGVGRGELLFVLLFCRGRFSDDIVLHQPQIAGFCRSVDAVFSLQARLQQQAHQMETAAAKREKVGERGPSAKSKSQGPGDTVLAFAAALRSA